MHAQVRNNDIVMRLMQALLSYAIACSHALAHFLYFRGQIGQISFNVDYVDQAHGKLIVRRNGASGGQDTVYFRAENPHALKAHRINGKTVQRILSNALLEGLSPVWLEIEGQRIQLWQGVHRTCVGDESCMQCVNEQRAAQRALRTVSPLQAGATLNPATILFRAP